MKGGGHFTAPREMTIAEYLEACAWYEGRPPAVQTLVDRLPPNGEYWLRDEEDGDRYRPVAYAEDGTMRMLRINAHTGEPLFQVFGMDPDQFVPALIGVGPTKGCGCRLVPVGRGRVRAAFCPEHDTMAVPLDEVPS